MSNQSRMDEKLGAWGRVHVGLKEKNQIEVREVDRYPGLPPNHSLGTGLNALR